MDEIIKMYYDDIDLNNYKLIKENNIDVDLLNYLFNFDFINKPVLNLYNQFITQYNNNYYLLFKKNNDLIDIDDIIYFLNQELIVKDNNIKDKWCKKIDYHEYQITQFGAKYLLLRESINYVIGLSEIGIQLLNTIKLDNCYSCLVHKRVTNKMFDFNNPLNICIDYRVRDISEYIKYMFFYENKEVFVTNINLNSEEYKLLFSRLLFITPYYDIYEKVIDNELEENEIKKITNKLDEYEKYLKKIYLYLKRYINIDTIELFTD